jgi:GntR family transcriptional regulator, vanillate catabolism transcriptional regulator
MSKSLPEADGSASQTVKALVSLRTLILAGDLVPGERIAELVLVERTGVSRTPIRAALVKLEEEGLLEAIPSGGYAVKAFSKDEIFDAIELRGMLEGLAARLAAERGTAPSRLRDLKDCLREFDDLLAKGELDADDFSEYIRLNAHYHAMIHEACGSAIVQRQIERAAALPFASPSGFVMAQSVFPEARLILRISQDQHRCIVEAIENREGARAEALMREHAHMARRNFELILKTKASLALVSGSALIRRRAAS